MGSLRAKADVIHKNKKRANFRMLDERERAQCEKSNGKVLVYDQSAENGDLYVLRCPLPLTTAFAAYDRVA